MSDLQRKGDAGLATEHPLVLFDGVCNLCSFSVQFIIDRDPAARFRFASLQSDVGKAAIVQHGGAVSDGDPESVMLIENGRIYERSTAALRIARHLSGLWWMLYALIVVPRILRDGTYKWIARNRYRWFGKTEACRIPTPELRERFLA